MRRINCVDYYSAAFDSESQLITDGVRAHTRRSQRKGQAHGSATMLIRRPNSVIAMTESFNIERGVLYRRET